MEEASKWLEIQKDFKSGGKFGVVSISPSNDSRRVVIAAYSGRTPEEEYRERRLMYFADALCLQGGFEASWLK